MQSKVAAWIVLVLVVTACSKDGPESPLEASVSVGSRGEPGSKQPGSIHAAQPRNQAQANRMTRV